MGLEVLLSSRATAFGCCNVLGTQVRFIKVVRVLRLLRSKGTRTLTSSILERIDPSLLQVCRMHVSFVSAGDAYASPKL